MFREMLLMFGMMLLMFQMISCVDQTCRFDQTEICSAALGHKLSLQMVPDSLHSYDAKLIHNKTGNTTLDPSCRIINDKMKVNSCDLYKSRSDVMISNGAVIINHVTREDSGRYTLDLFDSAGTQTWKKELHVNVEAPIGSVNVSVNCSSGERRVFCSSDGDELIFSWTLNGLPLTEGNDSIGLDHETSGNISCGVKNHVSHGEKSITLNYCTGADQTCRFDQTEICSAALGHKLSLQMVPDSQHSYDATLIHNKTLDPSCRIINDQMKVNSCDLYKSRSDVMISNGAVIINHVTREDSGRYTLHLFDSAGTQTSEGLHVNVEAPIGSVNVSVNCSSGERRVFCSSDGDELIFSWTLNGLPLTEGNDSIGLDHETSGNISCGVKNHVSHGEKSITLNYCTESTTVSVTSALTNSTLASAHVSMVFVIVWSLQMTILLLLLGGFHIYIRKSNTHTSGGKLEEEIAL